MRAVKPPWLKATTAALPSREAASTAAPQTMSGISKWTSRDALTDSVWPGRSGLAARAEERGRELLDAHQRVRRAAHDRGVRHRVEPKLPVDVLGLYVYLPG